MNGTLLLKAVTACTILLSVSLAGCNSRQQPVKINAGDVGEWPRKIPARISDRDNSDLFVMTLGDVTTSLADGIFDPVKDEVTLHDGTVMSNYYRDTLGIKQYSAMDKSIFPLPPSGLCTWYYYYQDINESEVRKNTDWIAENLAEYGAKYVQIDDGWQKETEAGRHGSRDWTGVDTAFSSGMASLAEYIKSRGLVPGIWIAPHGQSKFDVVKENPGVFLFKQDSTSASQTWEGDWLVDPTSPAAHQYLKDLFTMMVDWGYEYYKIDGQPIVVNEYRSKSEFMMEPGGDNVELYRKTLESIREAIGPERYLLGCWGTPVEGIGVMDGSRTGGDVVLGWSGFDVALMPTMRYYYLHNIAWYTDPDVMLLRQPLTIDQARVWATLQGLTGQALMSSDRLMDLSDERAEMMKRVYPAVDIRPLDLFPTNSRKPVWDLKVSHLGREYDIVGLFNFGEESLKQINLQWEDIGLHEEVPYHIFDFWNNEYLGTWEKGMAVEVAPTSCRVLTLLPDRDYIQLISTNRHITQGWIDLVELSQEGESISGKSHIIKDDPYQLHFVYPRGQYYKVGDIKVKGAGGKLKTSVMNHQGWSTVTVESPSSGDITWDIEFVKDDNYKYLTRDPGSVTVEATGLNSVKISWRAQYYLNSGYQVYLNDELMGYAPATYFTVDGLDPAEVYTADVRTVWMDGDINTRPEGGDQEYGTEFTIGSLLPSEVSLTDIAGESNSYTVNRPVTAGGVIYNNNISVAGGRVAEMNLSGIFKTFSARVAISDFNATRAGSSVTGRFRIIGDGNVLYTSPVMAPGDMPRSVTVNISGVNRLILETVDVSGMTQGRRGPTGVWINPVVTK
ncbi:MAG: NPCBM/NEW2 domain-containing protein [Bacteroidales bacterium]|nr:NPCBM/NEW2 domain-containing protein [Bacteroidales bacterium]